MITALLLIALGGTGVAAVWLQRRVTTVSARLDAAREDLQRAQESCALLAPSGIVQRVLSEGGLSTVAERKIATVMFTDLVGYTTLSERLEPVQLSHVLDGYFQLVSDAVGAHRGHVGTFLGDGILIYFGALEANPWQCNDAVHAALAIRAGVIDYNQRLAAEGLPPVAIGVGVHRGPGLSGLIGSRDRREYAFIGRTVNVAARVQALTREHNTDILLTEAVKAELDPRFALRELPARPVKGIAQPVVTYAIERAANGEAASKTVTYATERTLG